VLIVDDDKRSRAICASYCDLFDHTSETAHSGAEAVAAMRRSAFDVVVLNVHMATAGGVEMLRALRGLPGAAAATPIVGLAALGKDDESQRWLAAGLSAVVAKPVTASRFFAALSSAVKPEDGGARSWAPAR
jgi:CheY-like chemotaxis protein